jgi:hypothetical protein
MTDTFAAEPATERSRWASPVVLCVGKLMMVLDATVVDVALRRSRATSPSACPARGVLSTARTEARAVIRDPKAPA